MAPSCASELEHDRDRIVTSAPALAEECKNRRQLDALYCDENNDLVGDVSSDSKKLRDPSTLVFAYAPVEDPALGSRLGAARALRRGRGHGRGNRDRLEPVAHHLAGARAADRATISRKSAG